MVKLIYENGHFYRKRNGKLIQVNKYGIPINKADQISSGTLAGKISRGVPIKKALGL